MRKIMLKRTGKKAMYAIYLRKSRADMEAESRGEGETLSRHKNILLKLARKRAFEIGEIYTEIVSGESIALRPQMQKLLMDVENEKWTGVLVMEIERLCRGNSIDQGIVAQAFKESGTLIITPLKTYDPQNETDEEYFEFSLFMSRREYKTINRRLSAGKKAAAFEGKFIGSRAPYGYEKIRTKDGCTLKAHEAECGILKNIFEWYTNGIDDGEGRRKLGCYAIAKRLNEFCIPTRSGGKWSPSTIRDILKNPVYTGRIRVDYYKQTTKSSACGRKKSRIRTPQLQKNVQGLHEPLISEELFNSAAKQRNTEYKVPLKQGKILSNPLAGVMVCSDCKRHLIRRQNKSRGTASLLCTYYGCKNVSSYFESVENVLIRELGRFYKDLILQKTYANMLNSAHMDAELVFSIEQEIKKCETVLERIFELTERRIYSDEEYLKRRKALDTKIAALEKGREEAVLRMNGKNCVQKADVCEMPTGFSAYYDTLKQPKQKNDFIKCFVSKVIYSKPKKGETFSLDIFVRVPKIGEYKI